MTVQRGPCRLWYPHRPQRVQQVSGRNRMALRSGEQSKQGAPLRARDLHDLVADEQAQRAE